MADNGEIFNLWAKPPVDLYIKIYLFNITNAEAFLAGREKLQVEEVGPYVYKWVAKGKHLSSWRLISNSLCFQRAHDTWEHHIQWQQHDVHNAQPSVGLAGASVRRSPGGRRGHHAQHSYAGEYDMGYTYKYIHI